MLRRGIITVTLVIGMGAFPVAAAEPVRVQPTPDMLPAAANNPVFPFTPELGIWTLIVFLSLHAFLRRFVWLPYLEGLKKREAAILQARQEAEAVRREAEEAQRELERQIQETFAQIPGIMEQSRNEAIAARDALKSQALEEIRQQRQELLAEIERSKAEALAYIREHAADLASEIAKKAVGRPISREVIQRFALQPVGEGGA